MKILAVFCDIIMLCSPLKVNWFLEDHITFVFRVESQARYQHERTLPPASTLVSCSTYMTLKMEVICSSETSVDIQQTTWRYIPEDSTPREINLVGYCHFYSVWWNPAVSIMVYSNKLIFLCKYVGIVGMALMSVLPVILQNNERSWPQWDFRLKNLAL
jgi:hypothetical protein